MLSTFDAPDTTVTCARRERTNSPLQALTLLNDQAFFECAQHLGSQLAHMAADQSEDWLQESFRRCLSREPTADEAALLMTLYEDQLDLIRQLPMSEQQTLIGRSDKDPEEKEAALPPLDARAAQVAVIRMLMNLDEFITRQ